ncbi:hypothetical protein LCY76_09695 [Fictibacillus sp. KIGAM418]|uniref:Uncharacterized protein n=1 Tax=Fictibacillus marinisediminis TaxID=2878389 RepID=A0A9X1X9S5_9BACL|nr:MULTISPECIES: hypothetical protein [Fictibacillus]MCK6256867.1 hypothetical protein [Fictibacillus marinisediminis]MED2973472.1 hypothetical protein [Fictibacillus sp. B-59209]UZJ77303.1 hypothetical protein OKX00_14025 [Fictibacillus sp. KU28468]
MTLQDALYNWLSIKKVAEERTDDQAAADTLLFFDEILRDDHGLEHIAVRISNGCYEVDYRIGDSQHHKKFPCDYIDALWESIEAEPKYN